MKDDYKSDSKSQKKADLGEMGNDLIKKMDEIFYSKPSRNIMDSIDSFFQQSSTPFSRIPVDMYESDSEWVVKVDLPGVEKERINIDIVGDRIKISVSDDKEVKEVDDKYNYHRRERRYHRAERTVQMPYPIDKRTAKAKFKNGILEIRGPKKSISNYHLDIE
ncbi:Hsp20 family protein [Aquibacillus halophilus]|uniref:Hsp20 family protein n=1 Tax=Aquibacillus halophilus TaxID=930132 RepID=A0A6A8DEC5_9BACI|nr:Hsp20/alpha crystallin family protein [Aquibacillus halophilus]MRH44048.1 Hsp20 family protein [Aquibacillus halophilus]